MQNIAQERETLSLQKSPRAPNHREGAACTRGERTGADGRKGQNEPEPGGSLAGRMGSTGEDTGLGQGLSLPGWGTPLWSKKTPKRRESSKTSRKPTHHHPCSRAGGMTREGEALATLGKHRLLSTFICHHPASPSSSSPAPPTATVAGRGLRAGVMAPHTHAPKRSLKRSNMD